MSSIKKAYGTSTPLTITLASLAHSDTAARESTSVNNAATSEQFIDALVQLKVTLSSGTPSADRTVYVYAYGSEDGTIYTDNATGSDAAITLTDPPNAKLIGAIRCPNAGSLTYEAQPMGVAKVFDWMMPRKWGIIVRNNTNITLNASTSNHTASYTGIYFTNA